MYEKVNVFSNYRKNQQSNLYKAQVEQQEETDLITDPDIIHSHMYNITINNPHKYYPYNDEIQFEAALQEPTIIYYCHALEISTTGTPHMHIFIMYFNKLSMSHVMKRYPHAHVEAVRGLAKHNRDYVGKFGKWEYDSKACTKIEDSFIEWHIPYKNMSLPIEYLKYNGLILPCWEEEYNESKDKVKFRNHDDMRERLKEVRAERDRQRQEEQEQEEEPTPAISKWKGSTKRTFEIK